MSPTPPESKKDTCRTSTKKNLKSNPVKPSRPTPPKHVSMPKKSQNSLEPPLHLETSNRFGPLLKPSKSSSSSSISGPLFPPGFEDTIPPNLKNAHKLRRLMKTKKKAIKRKTTQSHPLLPNPPPLSIPNPTEASKPSIMISSQEIIDMANTIGLKYEGEPSELRARIDRILAKQKQDWDAQQS